MTHLRSNDPVIEFPLTKTLNGLRNSLFHDRQDRED